MCAKEWKDHLLSSGLPLEHSVRQILESLGLSCFSDFTYERQNELGRPALFSIDLRCQHINRNASVKLDVLLECKYRHDGTRWVFAPERFTDSFPRGDDVFIQLDELSANFKCNLQIMRRFAVAYELCAKGIELLEKESNPKTLTQAVQQLKYAVAPALADSIEKYYRPKHGEPGIVIVIPILVTTAELWRIKSGVTVENVRAATSVDEIATRCEALLLFDRPGKDLRQYSRKVLDVRYTDAQGLLNDLLRKNRSRDSSYEEYVDYLASYFPSVFMIVGYSNLRSVMGKVVDLFENAETINRRERVMEISLPQGS